MDYQYKIIISNRNVYREFEITEDMERVRVGTTSGCEFRLNPDSFFSSIELEFEKVNNKWVISCMDELYISKGDMRKLLSMELMHGETVSIRYADSSDEAFELRFMIDFEAKVPNYDWKIALNRSLAIGTSAGCDLYLKGTFQQNSKILLEVEGKDVYLNEETSAYGVYHNGRRISGREKISTNAFISMDEFSFYYAEGFLYVESKKLHPENELGEVIEKQDSKFQYPLFNRNTRIRTQLEEKPIQILDAPSIPKKPQVNIITSLMPSIAMLAVIVVLRGFMGGGNKTYVIMSVFSMGIGIVTSILGIISGQKQYKKDCRERIERYTDYIEKKRVEVTALRQNELENLNEIYCDIETDVQTALYFNRRLFERTKEDEDFLCVYLGRGEIESLRQIDFKKQDKLEVGDELTEMPEKIYQLFQKIEHAPISVNLKEANAVGFVGENNVLYSMFKNVVIDIAVRHYYGDVKMLVLVDDASKYNWLRLLPHLRNENGLRNIVSDNESKNNVFESLYRELTWREQSSEVPYHLVVLVENEFGIKNHPISRYIENASELGVTFLFFENGIEELPLHCDEIVVLHENHTGEKHVTEDGTKVQKFEYSIISDEDAAKVVRKLAPVYCEEISLESSLRKSITLYEMLHIYAASDLNLKQRWLQSQIYKSMAAPLGVNAKDEIVYLDLHEKAHGPHGLVAGTTGSGKSEILQTFILSAATIFHPYELGFVIIDFKGGGMVNQFKTLPHLIGAITNIDGNEVQRSLKSIKAELLKRQSLFAEAGVNHIDKYIQLYREEKVTTALPHLIIIVDEFAELKSEQPEFMKELISAARIGRSLGVHLILATQKPSGVVDAQIWSNSKFKLCLKVQSKEDSNEVLKTPLAAEIKEPGRAYLQVGNNEIFELLQSAYSGAPATMDEEEGNKEFLINQMNLAGMKKVVYKRVKQKRQDSTSKNQLDAVVDYISAFCAETGIDKLPNICMPPLPENLAYIGTQKTMEEELYANIGLLDDPDRQKQENLRINVTTQNFIIIGSAQSGKTTVLQTMIRSLAENYSPQELNMYIVDFGSMILRNFATLNQVGGVVCISDDEKLKNLFKLLNAEITVRKEKLAEAGVSSFVAYKEAGKTDLPQIVVFIDNLTALKEMYLQNEDFLMPLLRDGIAVGISFVVANNQTNGIGYRYLNNFEGRMALFCNETSEYSTLLEGCRLHPQNVAGRGVIQLNKAIFEVQTYLPFEGEKEFERVQEIRKFVEVQNDKNVGQKAKVIPEIPKELDSAYIRTNYPSYLQKNQIVLGLDYGTVQPSVLQMLGVGILTLSGKKEKGKDIFARYIVDSICNTESGAELYIFDSMNRKWKDYEYHASVVTYNTVADNVTSFVDEIEQRLQQRYEEVAAGETTTLDNEPWLVLLLENSDTISEISANKTTVASIKNIISKYKDMKVIILLADIENATISFNAPEFLKLVKENRKYIVFEDVSNIKLCDIPISVTKKYAKPIEMFDAYYINDNELTKLKTIKN